MEYTHEEILKGLEMIQEICRSNCHCASCPFNDGGDYCAITDTAPNHWEIKSSVAPWRAFE